MVIMGIVRVSEDINVMDEDVEQLREGSNGPLARIDEALGGADKLDESMAQQIEVLRVWQRARAGRGSGSRQLSSGA